jgi:thioredoxin reductase
MKETDVLIIGGSAAGMVAALTGKSAWPEKKFIMVKKTKRNDGTMWDSLYFRNARKQQSKYNASGCLDGKSWY